MEEVNKSAAIEAVSASAHEEITALWEASVRATHHFLQEEDILFYRPLVLHEYLKAVRLFCKKDSDSRIIGFLGTSEDKIEMLFIDPACRGMGIGKELMLYAINKLGIRKVDVNEQNEQAVGFYKRMGFYVYHRTEVDAMGMPYPVLQMEL